MDCAETDAEGVALGVVGCVEGEEEGNGVGSAGDGDADAVSGVDLGSVEGEGGGCGHAAFILSRSRFGEFEWWEWQERDRGG